jgi:hypothetical protein
MKEASIAVASSLWLDPSAHSADTISRRKFIPFLIDRRCDF